ncbi:S8 family serine peptidase [Methylobacterium oryzisoli]|uniref:S8 family serine peptidase n=1 Tax=Methylobacterium oryzisoli TaxID=3385502 RepID=UPI003891DB21
MADKVFVRLVPKSRQNISRMVSFEAALAPNAAQAFTPDPKQAQKAQVELASHSITALKTAENRLEMSMTPQQCADLFQVDVKRAPSSADAAPKAVSRLTKHETFLKPASELIIPDALKASIDFAYVPRPVEYFGTSFLPPMEDNYHLRLEAVSHAMNAAKCHRRGWTGRGVKVAMVDSGFARHPYLDRAGYNIVRLSGPDAGNAEKDDSGHGTGESANVLAIAPDVILICVKQGSSAAGDLETAISENPDIITCSWGWSIDNANKNALKTNDPNMFNELVDIETIVADVISRGTVACFSGGNGHLSFPACLPQVLAIGGAMIKDDGQVEASNYASSFESKLYPERKVPDFCGVVGSATKSKDGTLPGHIMLPVPPGSSLDGENFSPKRGGLGWGIFSGTSAAAPQVAGVVALMKSISPKLRPDQVRQILKSTAFDVKTGKSAMGVAATDGPDLATGAGLVDAFQACNAVAALS